MDEHATIAALLEVAESLGIEVRQSPASAEGSSRGGAVVRLKGREILFLDNGASLSDQISAVASALSGKEELQNRFLPPELREILDQNAEES